jgi:hypothetical protein
MPPVVVFIAGYLGVSVAAVYVGLAVMAVMTVYMATSMAKMKKMARSSSVDQGRNVQARDPVAPWRYIYGQIQVSGSVPFMYTTGANNEYLHFIVVMARHECEELGQISFADEVIPLDGSSTTSGGGGEATGKYAGHARILKFLGSTAGERDTALETETGGVWKTTSVGKGVARLHVRLKYNNDLFQNGLPAVQCIVKGKKVYDFRTGLTVYSNNSELCALDWLMDTKIGKAVPIAKINSAVAISDSNICDEDIVLVGASTEKRYATDGAAYSDQDPDQTLSELLMAMAGSISDAGGLFTVYAGAWRASSLSLGVSDEAGSFSYQARASRQDTYNGVKGTYISPLNKWVPGDFPAIKNDTYMGWDNGQRLWKEVIYNFTTSHARAQRLAKIDLELGRQQGVFRADYKLKAMQCQPNDTIDITRPRMGWTAKYFDVQEWGLRISEGDEEGGEGGGAITVSVTGKEIAAACFDWNDGEETTVDLTPDVNIISGKDVPAQPAAPTLSTSNYMQPDGKISPRIQTQWVVASDVRVTSGGVTEIEYKKTADADWKHWSSIAGHLTEDFITDVISDVQHKVRIRYRFAFGAAGPWSNESTITPAKDVTAPAAVASPVATSGPGCVVLDWDDNAEVDLDHYEVQRSPDGSTSWATIWSGYASQHADFSAGSGTTFYYRIRALDATDNPGAWSSTVNAAGEAGADGGYTDYVFKRAATIPATPTGDTPVGWSGAPPAADGNPLWMSVGDKTSAGVLVGAWATPVQIEGAGLVMEYSIDGSTSWHGTFTPGDLYARHKVFGGSFTAAYKIVGEDGADGADGVSPYFYNLTNARHQIRCDAEGTPLAGELGGSGSAFTDVEAWKGGTALTPVTSSPGAGQFSFTAAVHAGTATITKVDDNTERVDTVGSDSVTVRLTLNLEGVTTRDIDFILKKNTSGGSYSLRSTASAVNKNGAGAYNPSTVTFKGFAKLTSAAPTAYAGKFKIATLNSGVWTDVYTSAGDEDTKVYTVPGSIERFRCQLYANAANGGFSTFYDEIEVTITNDGIPGADGDDGSPGSPGSPGDDGDPGADGTDGATVLGRSDGVVSYSTSSFADGTGGPIQVTVTSNGLQRIISLSGIMAPDNTGRTLTLEMHRDGSPIDGSRFFTLPGGAASFFPCPAKWTDTPSAGSHTYKLQGKRGAAGVVDIEAKLVVI